MTCSVWTLKAIAATRVAVGFDINGLHNGTPTGRGVYCFMGDSELIHQDGSLRHLRQHHGAE
jgi:hypothetical protein